MPIEALTGQGRGGAGNRLFPARPRSAWRAVAADRPLARPFPLARCSASLPGLWSIFQSRIMVIMERKHVAAAYMRGSRPRCAVAWWRWTRPADGPGCGDVVARYVATSCRIAPHRTRPMCGECTRSTPKLAPNSLIRLAFKQLCITCVFFC
jgi:hypothetical protein